ncbi:MAG TPA: glycosyltransferase family 39 protein [Tepidisphaeraceae bacterium]|jgi:hypothetical protein|nr:glycosyltransferase family 39 protein [Tepidisphaeraceae bacterium]
MQRVAVPLLLVLGVQMWLVVGHGLWGRNFQLWMLVGVCVAAAIPPLRQSVLRAVDAIDTIAAPRRRWVTVGVIVASGAYLAFTALTQGRVLKPVFADDFSYILQTRMLAGGRFWMPQHELADFFESMHILVKPVYTSIYFPGAAMMFVPGVWLGWAPWIIPLLAAAAIVGLVYRIVAELLSDFDGLLAALLMVSLMWLRICSTMVASRIPVMLLGLAATWAWLRWRNAGEGRWRWTLLIGALCGWGAITRPLDALIFALPIGLAMVVNVCHGRLARPCLTSGSKTRADEPPVAPQRGTKMRSLARTLALLIIGGAPFLLLQGFINHNVTGQFLRPPFNLYADRDYPQTSYGLHAFDPTVRPESALKVKQDAYDQWVVPLVKEQQPDAIANAWLSKRVPMTFECILPHAFLLALVPVGLLGMNARRWVVVSVLPLFLGGYGLYTFFLHPYTLMAAPAAVLLVLAGRHVLATALPARGWTATFLIGSLITLPLTSLPETNRFVYDQQWPYVHQSVDDALATVQPPAIVLFHYGDDNAEFAKWPVFNSDVAWPDDAPVIRAIDLGPRNAELFRYYAARQPDRQVYRYDLDSEVIHEIGNVRELAGSNP